MSELDQIKADLQEIKDLIRGTKALDDDGKLVYSIREAYISLGWSRSKLHKEMKAGKIRFHRKGRRVLILKRELIEDITNNAK